MSEKPQCHISMSFVSELTGCNQDFAQSLTGEGFNFKFSHVIVGRMQFFMDLELMRASVFLLAVGRRPPPVPWPVGHSTELLVTWQLDTSA